MPGRRKKRKMIQNEMDAENVLTDQEEIADTAEDTASDAVQETAEDATSDTVQEIAEDVVSDTVQNTAEDTVQEAAETNLPEESGLSDADDLELEFIDEKSARDKSMRPDGSAGNFPMDADTDDFEQGRGRRKRRARVGIPVTIVIIAALLVGGWYGWKYYTEQKAEQQKQDAKQENIAQEENLIDQNISILVTNYLTAYATADTDSLAAFASPLSDLEKNYITAVTPLIEGYDGIDSARSDSVNENQYFVTVTANEIYKNTQTKLPKTFHFVVEKSEDGTYLINNLYSAFNLKYKEADTDAATLQAYQAYLKSADVTASDSTAQTGAQEALKADAALKKQVDAANAALAAWEKNSKNGTVIPAAPKKEAAKDAKKTTAKTDSKDSKTDSKDTKDKKSKDSKSTGKVVKKYKAGYRAYPTDDIRIRKTADTKGEVLATAYKDKELILYEEVDGGWYKIRTGDVTGYVKKEYCKVKKVKLKQ